MRVYAIGDIHGYLDKLQKAHALIEADMAMQGDTSAPTVHLGDLTDRGPDSKGVIQLLIDGIKAGKPWLTVKGNHDRMFAGHINDPTYHDPCLTTELEWLHPRLGGEETLASYGVQGSHPIAKIRAEIPKAHLQFLESMPLMHRFGDLAFVHAGINPKFPLNQQSEDDLLWIRKAFHDHLDPFEALIVHGHTPVDQATHYGNRINLDTGAGYGKALTCAVFEGTDCWILTDQGRVPLLAS